MAASDAGDARSRPDWTESPLDPFANVDPTNGGFTELRVHGVSGPPPHDVLKFPAGMVTRVKGNVDSGFWRRWMLGGPADDMPGRCRIEAFCWGGLTSRAYWQALWLLLLPFSLVNIAHWMVLPYTPGKGGGRFASVAVCLLRLLALSFTVTFALAGAEIVMDLSAWQCGSDAACQAGFDPVRLVSVVAGNPGSRVAVGGALLASLVVLLLMAGRDRFGPLPVAETGGFVPAVPSMSSPAASQRAGKDTPLPGEAIPPLGHPGFWEADQSTRWLRCLHTVAWCAVVGAVAASAATAPAAVSASSGLPGPASGIGSAFLIANLLVLGVVFFLVALPFFGRGGRGPRSAKGYWWVNAAAIALLAASLAVAWRVTPGQPAAPSAVPRVQDALAWLAAGQAVLLAVLGLCVVVLACQAFPRARYAEGYRPILRGGLAFVLPVFGWLLGLALSSGYGEWVADRIKGAVGSTTAFRPMLPALYERVDMWALIAVCIVLAWVIYLCCRVGHRTKGVTAQILGQNGRSGDERANDAAARGAARVQILAKSVESIPVMLAVVAVAGLATAAADAFGWRSSGPRQLYLPLSGSRLPAWLAAFPSAGAWVVTAGTAAVILVSYMAFRHPGTRRVVGILWDVTTFWPKANHPLTPACSAQRAVPQLRSRIIELTRSDDDMLVLSAHSQGSILAAAAALHAGTDKGTWEPRRTALLTYGSPLRRLYARAFPAYFTRDELVRVSELTGGKWVNMWAETDPVGAWLTAPAGEPAAPPAESTVPWTDWLMSPDPLTLGLDPRTSGRVAVCDHVGFVGRPEYPAAIEQLRVLLPSRPGNRHRQLTLPDGAAEGTCRLPPSELPARPGTWSVFLSIPSRQLVPNDLRRYLLGSQGPSLDSPGEDTIELYIQPGAPEAADRGRRWLPAPPDPGFTINVRSSQPEDRA